MTTLQPLMDRTMSSSEFELFCQLARRRRTTKVLAGCEQPVNIAPQTVARCDGMVRAALATAGWAPFHFAHQIDDIAEPWRATILWHTACRQLSGDFCRLFSDIKPGNKIPAMLAACGAVVLITELPSTAEDVPDPEKRQQVNFEHTLAVGAMIQTLLLALESAGLSSYWSSGGQLGTSAGFRLLGIPASQRLAGAVFVGYPCHVHDGCQRLEGSNRHRRSPAKNWTRELDHIPGGVADSPL